MGFLESVAYLKYYRHDFVEGEFTAALPEVFVQSASFDEFHGEIVKVVVVAEIVYANDVGVGETL